MKGGKYAKTLKKIHVRVVFHIRDFRRNVTPKFIEICIACVAGVRKKRGRELGRETTREGGGESLQGIYPTRSS